jgi:hypothetical protein
MSQRIILYLFDNGVRQRGFSRGGSLEGGLGGLSQRIILYLFDYEGGVVRGVGEGGLGDEKIDCINSITMIYIQ